MRPANPGSVYSCLRESRFSEADGLQPSRAQVGPTKAGSAEVGSAKVGHAEVRSTKVGSTKVGSAKVGPFEVSTVEIGIAEVGSFEVASAEIGLLAFLPRGPKPVRVPPEDSPSSWSGLSLSSESCDTYLFGHRGQQLATHAPG